MTPRLLLPAALGILGTALGAAALPAAAATAEPPTLAGRTVVTASRPAATVVRVPQTVHVPHDAVTVSGGGSVVALALVPDAETHGSALHAVRLPRETGQPVHVSGEYGAGGFVLRRGTYTLHVAPGERPATVTLRLPGLAGSRRFAPARPVRAGVRALTPSAVPSAAGVTYGAGQDVAFDRPGLLVSGIVGTRVGSSPYDAAGTCLYSSATGGVPAAARWTPYCVSDVNASGGTIDPYLTTAAGDRAGAVGLTEVEAGRSAFGVWLVSAGRVDRVTSFGFFLEYAV